MQFIQPITNTSSVCIGTPLQFAKPLFHIANDPDGTGGPGPNTTEAGQTITTTSNNVDTTTAAPIPGQTIVSQTNSDGAPIVATFAPTTLNEYTTLQSETTVTTTTTRDGVPIIFPLVIGLGGVAWVPVGVSPPGIVPPDPGDDSDEGDDGNDEDSTTQTQPSTTTTSSSSSTASSSASSTETTVTAIGDVNYPNWEAINQVPLNPNAPIPEGDDFATTTSTSSSSSSSSSSPSPPAPAPTTTTPPTPTSTLALYPTGLDVNCLPSHPAGNRMLSCINLLNRIPASQTLCTSDPDACLSRGDSFCAASGGSCDPSGTETINTSNYCLLAQSSGCAFVIANKQPSFGGFPGSSCVTGAQMDQFIRGAANRCAGAGAGGG
ncbi:MAG: hypothetical protein LQ339_004147 [Xanthoria mediterranea]|nr:MAG: hypothetical protein LQ339_004147 [Xanthoria mediterranea]